MFQTATLTSTRELWRSIMHYGDFDQMPVIHWKGWPETTERWIQEGMPKGVDEHEFLNAVPMWHRVGVNVSLYPAFEERTLEENESYRIFRDSTGVVQKDWKTKSCIPHYTDFTLKEAKDWPEYKKRLQPDPARIPADLDDRIAQAEASGLPIVIGCASMMGWIRNWMGVENMSYLIHDDRACYADIVNTLADLVCWAIDQVAPRMKTKIDMGHAWEDICGKQGPLISPQVFKECVAPGYLKIRNKLESYGVDLFSIDSDGKVEPLIRSWLDSGVNVMFPLEPGTWKATPEAMRLKFGKDLRIIGGYDKLVLEKDSAAIDAELQRHVSLLKTGGFVLMPDHLITPDTPLNNYQYYLERVRRLRF